MERIHVNIAVLPDRKPRYGAVIQHVDDSVIRRHGAGRAELQVDTRAVVLDYRARWTAGCRVDEQTVLRVIMQVNVSVIPVA